MPPRLHRTMLTVVVPTYNERGNLRPLVDRIDAALGDAGVTYEVLVVDDDSPDGTADEARALADAYPVRVIQRTGETGLATAVVRGFRDARHDRIAVMDADLQHPPETLPDLLQALEDGADVAVGSRFVEGGSMPAFGPVRKLVSSGADLLARTVFRNLRDVRDLQSGFFALHRHVVEDVDLDPRGYKILLEVLVLGRHDHVEEVGYTFGQRHAGESKLGLGNVLAYLQHLAGLSVRSGEAGRFLRFGVVGGLGAVLNLATLYTLTTLGVWYLAAGAVAIEVGLLSNFLLNWTWTYADHAPAAGPGLLRALGRDHLVRSGGMLINITLLGVLTSLAGLWYVASQAVGIGAAMAWNYSGNQWWTWGDGDA